MTSISGELMEGWSLQITCKIAKRAQTINIVIWQADILLQVNECARSVIVRFTRRQIGKHTQTARLQIHTCALAERSSRGETTRQKHWLTAVCQSPLKRCWKWVTYVYWFCCFSSLMLKLLNGWKQEELPEAQRLNMCIFDFPNHFSWQTGALFPFPRHPFLVVFFLSFFLFFPFSSEIIFPTSLCQQLPTLLYSTGKTRVQKAGSHTKAMQGGVPFSSVYMVLMSLLPELKGSFNLIAFSLLLPPTSNMQRDPVKHAIRSLGEKLYALSTFLAQFHATLMNFFFFSTQTGKCWLRAVGIYQKLSAAQLKRSFDSNPREEGGAGGEDRDERNRLIRETLQQPCS